MEPFLGELLEDPFGKKCVICYGLQCGFNGLMKLHIEHHRTIFFWRNYHVQKIGVNRVPMYWQFDPQPFHAGGRSMNMTKVQLDLHVFCVAYAPKMYRWFHVPTCCICHDQDLHYLHMESCRHTSYTRRY